MTGWWVYFEENFSNFLKFNKEKLSLDQFDLGAPGYVSQVKLVQAQTWQFRQTLERQENLTWTMDTRTSPCNQAWKSGSQTLACGPCWAFFVPHLWIPLFRSALETRIDDQFFNHQSLAICCVNLGEKRVKCQLIIT